MRVRIKPYIILFCVFFIYIIISNALEITCPIKYFTGEICPTCGTTRALMELIRLDINEYVRYNFMALPMTVAVLLYISRECFKSKYLIDLFVFGIIIINLIVYIIRLSN